MRLWQQIIQIGQSKKLIAAARHWASRPANQVITDDRLADPEEWQAAVEAQEKPNRNDEGADDDDDGLFPVYAQNWDTVTTFCNLRHCWRVDSWTGRYMGIIRSEITSTLGLMQIAPEKHLVIFEDLMIMEDAALEVLNRK